MDHVADEAETLTVDRVLSCQIQRQQNTIPAFTVQRPTGGLVHNCLGHLLVVPNLEILELARNPGHLEQ